MNSTESPVITPALALRAPEAAKAVGLSERTLWSKTKSNEIPHVKVGKSILYPVRELQNWLTQNTQGGGQ